MKNHVIWGVTLLFLMLVLPVTSFSSQKAPELIPHRSLMEESQTTNLSDSKKLTFSEKLEIKKGRIKQRIKYSKAYRMAMATIISYGIGLVLMTLGFFGVGSAFLIGILALIVGLVLGLLTRIEVNRNPSLEGKEMLRIVRILGVISWIVGITLVLLGILAIIFLILLIGLFLDLFG